MLGGKLFKIVPLSVEHAVRISCVGLQPIFGRGHDDGGRGAGDYAVDSRGRVSGLRRFRRLVRRLERPAHADSGSWGSCRYAWTAFAMCTRARASVPLAWCQVRGEASFFVCKRVVWSGRITA